MAKGFTSITVPSNRLPFQQTRIPPEAPIEGAKMNLSKHLGAKFLIKVRSNISFFVS
jgi:hypothetical protein